MVPRYKSPYFTWSDAEATTGIILECWTFQVYLYLMLIQEIHVFHMQFEMNFQCMILPVTNAALVIAGKSAKFR